MPSAALLTMSQQEFDCAEWMLRIRERRATQAHVAVHLGVSVRQVERMYRAYKASGAAGLASKKRGQPSTHRLPDALRAAALGLVRALYGDFRPTLACEKLAEVHGVLVSVETLRKWMIADGMWLPRAARRARPHPPRYRRPCLGELVQIDGCDHEWFEERAPRCTLLVFVDDGGKEFAKCIEKRSMGDYVFVKVSHFWDSHGYYDWDIYEVDGCPRPIELDSPGSYEKSQECRPTAEFGRPNGFTCNLRPEYKLVDVCPWTASD